MLGQVTPLLVIAGIAVTVASLPAFILAGTYLWYDPSGSPVERQSAESSISVLVPTYNEKDIIVRKLEELVSLDYPMADVEIVVVDSSDDATAKLVRQFFQDRPEPELQLVTQSERQGVATALNEGIKAASGDVVFRTDADSSLADDVLKLVVDTLSNSTVGGVTGRQVDVLGESTVEADYRDLLSFVQLIESHVDSTFICHGPCFGFERELYEPIPKDTIADDTETGIRIREEGHRIVMDPEIGFVESGVSAFGDRRQRKDRRAAGLLQTLYRHRDSVGKFGNYGRFVLPLNWMLLVMTPWATVITVLSVSVSAIMLFGAAGFAVPGGLALFFWLGSTERLGPVQPAYAVFDSQVSLIVSAISLIRGSSSAIWQIDEESRDAFRE